MEVKAGYKQTEVGVLPEDWAVINLGGTCTQVTTGKLDANAMKENGEYRFYTCAKTYCQIDAYAFDTEALLVSGNGANVGYIHYYKGKFNAYQRTYVLSGFLESIKYLQHYMGQKLADRIRVEVNAGNTPYITRGTLTEMKVALPPTKAEQEAIAEALSDADALIESLEQLLTKKRHLKQGAMQELLTGKKRLPGFSAEWEVKRLGDVADTDSENLGTDTRPNFVFNYIALEDVDVGRLTSYSEQVFQTAPSRARRRLRKNDVLVSTVRPNLQSHFLFTASAGNWVCSTGFCVVRCREGLSYPGYVYFHLFGASVVRQIESLLTGSNYPAINGSDVRALHIPFPGYEEQSAIAAILSDMDAEIAALETKLTKVRQFKQGMMQELLTGRIRLV